MNRHLKNLLLTSFFLILFSLLNQNNSAKAFTLDTNKGDDNIYVATIKSNQAAKSVTLSINLIGENIKFREYKDISGVLSIGTCNSQNIKLVSTKVCLDLGAFNSSSLKEGQILGEFKFNVINPRLPAKILSANSIYEEGIEVSGTLFEYNIDSPVTPTPSTIPSVTPTPTTPPSIITQINIILCGIICTIVLFLFVIFYLIYSNRKNKNEKKRNSQVVN